MKTPIRIGDDGTKKTKNSMYQIGPQERAKKRKIYEKNEKWKLSKRTPQMRKSTKNLRKKRKMKTIQKDTTKAQMHEKSTKNEKSYRKPARRTRTKNPRKKNEKLCASKDPTPIGRKINATNPGPLKILEETKKTKIFRGPRKIHEKSQITLRKRTKN